MIMLSLCLIVKNEEKYIEECVKSFGNTVSELIVVDTGSTDKTIEIAKKLGAKVFDFKWMDDFSAARNFATDHATGDWIMVVDADERLAPGNQEKLLEALNDKSVLGYNIPIYTYSNDKHAAFWHPSEKAKPFEGFLITKAIRLFQNYKDVRYRFAIHESVIDSIKEAKGQIKEAPFFFHHHTCERGNESLKGKKDYYIRLSKNDALKYPNSSKPFYEMGVMHYEYGELEEAKAAFIQAAKNDSNHFNPYYYLGEIALRQNHLDEAKSFFEKDLGLHPNNPDSFFGLGKTLVKLNSPDAKKYLHKALLLNPKKIIFYEELLELHLANKEYFAALALFHDAYANTHYDLFLTQLQNLERYLTDTANHLLAKRPDETAYMWLATIFLYRKDKESVLSICEQAKKHFPNSNVLKAIYEQASKYP